MADTVAALLGFVGIYVTVASFIWFVANLSARYLLSGRLDDDMVDGLAGFIALAVTGVAAVMFSMLRGSGATPLNWLMLGNFIVAPAVMTAVAFLLPRVRKARLRAVGKRGELRVSKALKASGFDVVSDVYVEHEGEIAQIDHIVRAGDQFVVVETKNVSGLIFARDGEPEWTLKKDAESPSSPIRNPVHQVSRQARIATGHFGWPFARAVVFLDRAKFPKGHPKETFDLDGLIGYLEILANEEGIEDADAAWELLRDACHGQDKDSLKQRHERQCRIKQAEKSYPGTRRGPVPPAPRRPVPPAPKSLRPGL